MEAAIRQLARNGHKGTTFQSVAKEANVSSALVVLHFQSVDRIFSSTLEYIINEAREKTERAVQLHPHPLDRLRAYFQISFELVREDPDKTKIYLMMYYFSLFDSRIRALNSLIKKVAESRIEGMLKELNLRSDHRIGDTRKTARVLHDHLIGSLIGHMSTDDPLSAQEIEASTIETLLSHL